jgi:hypothetical protein
MAVYIPFRPRKVMPEGIWVPTRGRIQGFYRAAVYPEGVTLESYAKMTAEEKSRIDPLFTFRARRSTAPHLILIDPQSIKINRNLPDAEFLIEYPPSAVVYDEKSGQSLLGGKRPLPKKVSPRAER